MSRITLAFVVALAALASACTGDNPTGPASVETTPPPPVVVTPPPGTTNVVSFDGLSADAKTLAIAQLNFTKKIRRWANGSVIRVWADPVGLPGVPGFKREDVLSAVSFWQTRLPMISFEVVDDRSRANAIFDFDISMVKPSAGACGIESPPTSDSDGMITFGNGHFALGQVEGCYYRDEDAKHLAHGLGHVLGFYLHTNVALPGVWDIMSSPFLGLRASGPTAEVTPWWYVQSMGATAQ